jgi:hypothetical protein
VTAGGAPRDTGGRRYPIEPLLDMLAHRGLSQHAAAELVGMSGSSLVAAREKGLLVKAADRCAMRAGFHPAEVWPSWVADALEDHGRECAECCSRFVPAQGNHRFCRAVCRERWWGRESKRRAWARMEAAKKERRLEQMRQYRRSCAAALSTKRRARYAATAEAERAAERARYWSKREAV